MSKFFICRKFFTLEKIICRKFFICRNFSLVEIFYMSNFVNGSVGLGDRHGRLRNTRSARSVGSADGWLAFLSLVSIAENGRAFAERLNSDVRLERDLANLDFSPCGRDVYHSVSCPSRRRTWATVTPASFMHLSGYGPMSSIPLYGFLAQALECHKILQHCMRFVYRPLRALHT